MKDVMKILVIDHHTEDRGINIRDRMKKLTQDGKLAPLGILSAEDISHRFQVAPEGTPCQQAIKDGKGLSDTYLSDYHSVTEREYILILLHIGNGFAEEQERSFYHEKCLKIPTVIYSGGGIDESSKPSSGLTYYHKKPVGTGRDGEGFFLEEFLVEWASQTEEQRKADRELRYAVPPFSALRSETREAEHEEKRQTLRYKLLEPFSALDILLQGYLAVKDPTGFAQQVVISYVVDTSHPNFAEAETEIRETPCLWFRECWEDVRRAFLEVDKHLSDLGNIETMLRTTADVVSSTNELRDLLSPGGNSALIHVCKAIHECARDCVPKDSDECKHVGVDGLCQRCQQIGDGILFDESKIRQAHDDYLMAAKWFDRKPIVDEFLEFRNFVSHTMLKHSFMIGSPTNPTRNRNRFSNPHEWALLRRKISDMFGLGPTLFGLSCDEVFTKCRDRVDELVRAIECFGQSLVSKQSLSPQQQEDFVAACNELMRELSEIPDLLRKSDTGFSPRVVSEALGEIKPEIIRGQIERSLQEDIAPLLSSLSPETLEDEVILEKGALYWQQRSDLDNLLFKHRVYNLFHSVEASVDEWVERIKAALKEFDKLAESLDFSLSPDKRRDHLHSYILERERSSVKELVEHCLAENLG